MCMCDDHTSGVIRGAMLMRDHHTCTIHGVMHWPPQQVMCTFVTPLITSHLTKKPFNQPSSLLTFPVEIKPPAIYGVQLGTSSDTSQPNQGTLVTSLLSCQGSLYKAAASHLHSTFLHMIVLFPSTLCWMFHWFNYPLLARKKSTIYGAIWYILKLGTTTGLNSA